MQRSLSGRSAHESAFSAMGGGGCPRPARSASGVRGGIRPSGRIDDQRGSVVEVALDEPELIVVAGPGIVRVDVGDPGQGRQGQLIAEHGIEAVRRHVGGGGSERGKLLVGQAGLARPRRGPLERRGIVVRPDALQVRIAIRGAGNAPLAGGRLSPRRDRRKRNQRNYRSDTGNDETVQPWIPSLSRRPLSRRRRNDGRGASTRPHSLACGADLRIPPTRRAGPDRVTPESCSRPPTGGRPSG